VGFCARLLQLTLEQLATVKNIKNAELAGFVLGHHYTTPKEDCNSHHKFKKKKVFL
jgi:hypothetical protein